MAQFMLICSTRNSGVDAVDSALIESCCTQAQPGTGMQGMNGLGAYASPTMVMGSPSEYAQCVTH